jgi:hypothetical protein
VKLPDTVRDRLVWELGFAVDKMRAESHPHAKLYYFSVFFTEANRILNMAWDTDLLLLHNVTQATQTAIASRLTAMAARAETPLGVPPDLFDLLTSAAADLLRYVEQDGSHEELCGILGRLSELAYATTGNGHYLLEKGAIKL